MADTHPRDLDVEETRPAESISEIGLTKLGNALRVPGFLTKGPVVIEGNGKARKPRPEDYASQAQRARAAGAVEGRPLSVPLQAPRPPMNPLSEEAAKLFSSASTAGAKKLAADMLAQAKERTVKAEADQAATAERADFMFNEGVKQLEETRAAMKASAQARTHDCQAEETRIARWGEWHVEEAEREARAIAEKHARDRSIAEKVAAVLDEHDAPLRAVGPSDEEAET